MPDYWSSIWDTLWWALTFIVMVAYLLALFSIITDLFRDRKLSGWAKAIWMIFLIFLPFITAL
ncbi:MAG TPA: PLDc N-terminal domain-containing protein, partial [Marmoricola sp.]|nr:PLDc N-terminal domain-containing protein [Marmoricola sp.]